MRKFLIVKIWIALEIVAVLAVAVLVLLKVFVWQETEQEPNYKIPQTETKETDLEGIPLPRDLTADEYEEDIAAADADLNAESDTVTGSLYEADYPEEVMAQIGKLNETQKIELLLMTTPEVLCEKDKVTVAGNIFQQAFAEKGVSGLIFSDKNFVSDAAGMEMFKTIRGWSRDAGAPLVLLGYAGNTQVASKLSDRGFNLLFVDGVSADAIGEAAENCMVPAVSTDPANLGELGGSAVSADSVSSAVSAVVETEEADAIIDLINEGRTCFYRVKDYTGIREALIGAAQEGVIFPEALDKSAGYALTVRYALTQMRPEEFEKEVPKTTPSKKKKTQTPEEQAAEAAQKLQEQAIKDAQKAQKEAQKQAEQLQKQLQEQAAAAAAAAAQAPAAVQTPAQ
ncbi:MAG: hypothetical protein J5518_00745 [Lachnospiraceae bacterium]|nr:hypothetical protein [Lachnospiraceae bacterium]